MSAKVKCELCGETIPEKGEWYYQDSVGIICENCKKKVAAVIG